MTDILKTIFTNNKIFYAVILLVMLVQVFPFGFGYVVISDDWFAYALLSTYTDNIAHAISFYGLYGFRPLAGILDLLLIAPLWPNLAPALLVITIMRFLFILLLDNVLTRCDIAWGRAATIFFAFFPTLTEAAYWLNASTRIVSAGFFAMLGVYAMFNYIDKTSQSHRTQFYIYDKYNSSIDAHKNVWLAVALFSGLVAQAFYEQGILFAFTITLGALLLRRHDIKSRLLYVWPFANLAIISAYYFWVSISDVGHLTGRTTLNLNIFGRFISVITTISWAFIREQAPTVINTATWGIGLLLSQHTILTIILAILSVILAFFVVHSPLTPTNKALSAAAAAVLAICTLTIYFILEDNWVWVRNFYFALIGLAIFAEMLARLLLGNIPQKKPKVMQTVVILLATPIIFVSLAGFTLEIISFRAVQNSDTQIVLNVLEKMDEWEIAENSEITVGLFAPPIAHEPQITPRITSLSGVDWAINAHIRGIIGSREHPWLQPIANGEQLNLSTLNVDFLITLDENLDVQQLYFDGEHLFFADTDEPFGMIITTETGENVFYMGFFGD
ncbi:MAG: hypothetical protein FWG68_10170 [Defluviitaleaceae bacterium]|nr:hypothetical protein [Defluviitaleaceae bacterium]